MLLGLLSSIHCALLPFAVFRFGNRFGCLCCRHDTLVCLSCQSPIFRCHLLLLFHFAFVDSIRFKSPHLISILLIHASHHCYPSQMSLFLLWHSRPEIKRLGHLWFVCILLCLKTVHTFACLAKCAHIHTQNHSQPLDLSKHNHTFIFIIWLRLHRMLGTIAHTRRYGQPPG